MRLNHTAVLIGAVPLACEGCDKADQPPPNARSSFIPTRISPITPEVAATTTGVSCTLSVQRTGDRLLAILEFRNDRSASVDIPQWMLIPDGKLSANLFHIIQDGMELSYLCPKVNWGPASKQSVITLDARETFSTETDIFKCYDFTVPGTYRIQSQTAVWLPSGQSPMGIASNEVDVTVPQ